MAVSHAEWAASAEAELADLERTWEMLDIPGHRVELIDQFANPATVALYSQPGEIRYQSSVSAVAGESLQLPEPFGIALDTGKLLS